MVIQLLALLYSQPRMQISPCVTTTSLLALLWNYGTWTVPQGLERLATSPQETPKKRRAMFIWAETQAACLKWKYRFSLFVGRCEKAGRSILLLTVPRPDVVLQMNTNNRHEPAKSWLQTAHDRLTCSLGLPAVPWQEVLLWSWVNHHSPNRNYWCHGSTERKKNMLLHILF